MSSNLLSLQDVDLHNKRVLIREDFNVPIKDGVVENDLRIRAALPGIKLALQNASQVLLMSHLGRPQPGKWEQQFSLQPVAERLQQLLNMPVTFIGSGLELPPVNVKLALYENVRFFQGETDNSADLAQRMASLCDVFVLDAFGSAHRAHASTVGVAEFAPLAVAGPLLIEETSALDRIMLNPAHPLVVIIGGAKISGKIEALSTLVKVADAILIGGGMANTFLAAQGINVADSLYEPEQIPAAMQILDQATNANCKIMLPVDAVINGGEQKKINEINGTDKILDIGALTISNFVQVIANARTILWNGPVGVFQDVLFANGTKQIAVAIAASKAYSVAGGGETITALEQFKFADKISYISTGGGAFLEYLEGKSLPSIKVLAHQ